MPETATSTETQELRKRIDVLSKELGELCKSVKDRAITGSKEWAEEHPAAAIGVVAGVSASIGFILGLMVARNRG
jgi:ElaB/YqjD/DUF883 family membrane-anchored ribosome-binding protein